MSAPHYIARRVGDQYVLVRQNVGPNIRKPELLIGGAVSVGLGFLQQGLARRLLISMGGTVFVLGLACQGTNCSGKASTRSVRRFRRGPSYQHENEGLRLRQKPLDEIDEASMESFPASDAPARVKPAID